MKRRVALATVLVSLLVAACGTDGDGGGGGQSGGQGGGQAQAPRELKIAVVAPLSGAYAIYGKPILDGAQIAVDQINGSGGIPRGRYQGARLVLVPFDDQLDPKQDADAAQKVVDDPSIWAFTGLAASDGALAAKPIVNRAGVPLVSSYASSPQITNDARRTFIIASPHGAYAYGGVQAAKDAGSSQIAILQITGEFGDSISRLSQQAATAKGMRVTTVQTMSSGDTDVQVQVLAAKNSGADTLLTIGYASDVVAAVTAAARLDWKPRMVDAGGGAFDPSVPKNAGAAAEGVVGVVDYDAASTTPANQAFTSAYRARFGSADVPPPAAHGYETVRVIATAFETGPSDRAALGDALYKVSLPDTGVGALSFDANGNPIGRPMWTFRIVNGAFVFDRGYTYDGKDVQPLPLAR
jgi:branched-chain amino acid transport system substrate-binding protein